METLLSPLWLLLLLMTAVLIIGIILFIKGRPYKSLWLVLHILISLGTMVYLGIKFMNRDAGADGYGSGLIITAVVAMGLLLLSGFLLLRERGNRILMNLLHALLTLVLAGSLAGMIWGF